MCGVRDFADVGKWANLRQPAAIPINWGQPHDGGARRCALLSGVAGACPGHRRSVMSHATGTPVDYSFLFF